MSNQNQPILVSVTPGGVFKSIAVILLFYFLFIVRDIVLVFITAVVLASAVEPFTAWFVKKRIPRIIAVLIIYIVTMILLGTVFYFFVPGLIGDLRNLVNVLPSYVSTLSDKAGLLKEIPEFNNVLNNIANTLSNKEIFTQIGGAVSGVTYSFFSLASGIFGGILSFILIIVLSFYLAVQEDGVGNFLRIVSPSQHENYVIDLWGRARRKIGLWMQGQVLLGVLVGILTYLGLSILGIENALLLAVVAAMFELIPIFGPILASVPAIAFGLAQGGPTLGILVVGLYVIIQQFESQLIHPLVVKKIVGIPALIAILSLIIGAKIAGFLGIIVSVPIAAAIMEYVNDLEKKKIRELKSTGEIK